MTAPITARYDDALYDVDVYGTPTGEIRIDATSAMTVSGLETREIGNLAISIQVTVTRQLAPTVAIDRTIVGDLFLLAASDVTIDALRLGLMIGEVSAYAIVQRENDCSCDASAVVIGELIPEIAADAVVYIPTLLFADALIDGLITHELVANAIVEQAVFRGIVVDAEIAEGPGTGFGTADLDRQLSLSAFYFVLILPELAADALLIEPFLPYDIGERDCVADAVVRGAEVIQLVADAMVWNRIDALIVLPQVHATAVVVDFGAFFFADAFVRDLNDLWTGPFQILLANAVILNPNTRRSIYASAVISLTATIVQRSLAADAVIEQAPTQRVLGQLGMAVVFVGTTPFYDSVAYPPSSHSYQTGVTIDRVPVVLTSPIRSLSADALVAEDGKTLDADAIVAERDRLLTMTADTIVQQEGVRLLPITVAIANYRAAPREVRADAVVQSFVIYPVPAQERLI